MYHIDHDGSKSPVIHDASGPGYDLYGTIDAGSPLLPGDFLKDAMKTMGEIQKFQLQLSMFKLVTRQIKDMFSGASDSF